jgi:hypothetical protein
MKRSAALGKRPLEKEIQASICEHLDVRRLFWWRNNTGAFKTEHGGFVRFGTPGSPDIIVVKDGRAIFLGVKRPGSYQPPEQEEFQANAERLALPCSKLTILLAAQTAQPTSTRALWSLSVDRATLGNH